MTCVLTDWILEPTEPRFSRFCAPGVKWCSRSCVLEVLALSSWRGTDRPAALSLSLPVTSPSVAPAVANRSASAALPRSAPTSSTATRTARRTWSRAASASLANFLTRWRRPSPGTTWASRPAGGSRAPGDRCTSGPSATAETAVTSTPTALWGGALRVSGWGRRLRRRMRRRKTRREEGQKMKMWEKMKMRTRVKRDVEEEMRRMSKSESQTCVITSTTITSRSLLRLLLDLH